MPAQIGFLGFGKMAEALFEGLPEKRAFYFDPSKERQSALQGKQGLEFVESPQALVEKADLILLCTKPLVAKDLLESLKFSKTHRLVSICAGLRLADLGAWSRHKSWVRVMPNLGAAVGESMSVLSADKEDDEVEEIFKGIGKTLWLAEERMDAVTAISGSGPGFFLEWMKGFQSWAETEGFSSAEARLLVAQTALGTARLVLEDARSLSQLTEAVATKGGTTEAGLNSLREDGLSRALEKCLQASKARSKELAAS